MECIFNDILEIRNGKNQKAVENPDGRYPIYGSGGLMGYADDYICEADTVIIGRKGSINNPIYVSEPFWNVDTAFGLSAKREVLLPRYLFYFCKKFDFEKLNKTVTIPSLTKSDLLKIKIQLPDITVQQDIIDKLSKIEKVIDFRKQELAALDNLIKARFVELFGNGNHEIVKASEVCDFITKGTTPPTGEITEEYEEGKIPFLKVYNLSFTGEMLFDDNPQYIPKETHNGKLVRSKVYPNDVLMNIVGPPLGKFTLVTDEFDEWNINQAIAIFRAKERILPRFLLHALMQPKVLEPFIGQAVGIRQQNLNLEQCRNLQFPLPSLEEQKAFVEFAEQLDKSKVVVKKALDEVQLLFDSLMQEYFS
ncbi:MAG: restriction endonuclease subunit S [Clostridiales bacterium]|nr:restriction endonuclease subunit S [Clostridiales bacterium]